LSAVAGSGASPTITSYDANGWLSWTNVFTNGACCVEAARGPLGPWAPSTNVFTLVAGGRANIGTPAGTVFYRLLATDLSIRNPDLFGDLTRCYGRLSTIAGSGLGSVDGVNYWQSAYEGGFATNAALSRPHFAMADSVGNVFIIDKNSHALLKLTPDGRIHTAAGTHESSNGTDSPALATTVGLSFPNGLWVGGDDSVYILDTGNGKVRWLNPNGVLTTLFTDTNGISGGRGLWVKDDHTLAYFVNGNDVKRWAPGAKIKSVNDSNFIDPGNFIVNADGSLVVTDRGDNRVYLLQTSGSRRVLYGNGSSDPVVDNTPALASGLYGVRGVWSMPIGGHLLSTHEGSQVLYVDAAGLLHIFVQGNTGGFHTGDGQWFYSSDYKVSEVRSVTMDSHGNVFIVENDAGYVRKIEFLRLEP
jgi:hypothetical protein